MDPDHLRDLFASFRPVTVRRMFGGAGLYADGVMFALWSSGGTLYLKIDEHNEPDFVREGSAVIRPDDEERQACGDALSADARSPVRRSR